MTVYRIPYTVYRIPHTVYRIIGTRKIDDCRKKQYRAGQDRAGQAGQVCRRHKRSRRALVARRSFLSGGRLYSLYSLYSLVGQTGGASKGRLHTFLGLHRYTHTQAHVHSGTRAHKGAQRHTYTTTQTVAVATTAPEPSGASSSHSSSKSPTCSSHSCPGAPSG